jgi:hypothetical protein
MCCDPTVSKEYVRRTVLHTIEHPQQLDGVAAS